MSRIFRRTLSSLPGPSSAPAPFQAVANTLPLAVRRRRLEQPPSKFASPSPLSDAALLDPASGKKFPLPLEKDYRSLLKRSEFDSSRTDAELRAAYLSATSEWRSRVRGYAPQGKNSKHAFLLKKMGGRSLFEERVQAIAGPEGEGAVAQEEELSDIVGQRIYLPNITIRLVRNHTPPGEAYDPFVATFRIPRGMTKTDLRSYLHAVYGLEVTFIRTDNYLGQVGRARTAEVVRKGGGTETYKRAVVGLKEPFHYPDDVEEYHAKEEEYGSGAEAARLRKEYLQTNYSLNDMESWRDKALFKFYKGSRWRSQTHANAGVAVKEIMKRRKEREGLIEKTIKDRYAVARDIETPAATAETQNA
ncbi:hypothetical protein L198_00390 [Cryptococcus wingfieldii CBS 7118]|uniref:Large ribosomal subunit protein uL23m n=1 Tax=Cryptococcus wingfieldii CBS 7118 TaxID=1295528 RepID=A0A1E3K657_9TREE|nr:hypothetical protein L198_00390 [Cryptococcus wingfieldii CBS 7118]ODO08658.1 hypothetical protein L198_00390 [Cryptococcus wingfieldii CBS 7118]